MQNVSVAKLTPPKELRGSLTLPGSKSFTNRALIAAALADGTSELLNASASEDTRLLLGALIKHGVHIDLNDAMRKIIVHGGAPGGCSERNAFYLGNAGTAVRFLTAYLTLHEGNFVIDGDLRMRQRPIEDLLSALRQLGGDVKSAHGNGCPPIGIRAAGLKGGKASVKADVSSQYVSALLLAAPYAEQGVELELQQDPTSRGYIDMTLAVMRRFGVEPTWTGRSILVKPAHYSATTYYSEPDAAGANYLFAAAAVTGGSVRVNGLGNESVQSERKFVDVLRRMGCSVEESEFFTQVKGGELAGIDIDMNASPDSVQTLAAVALFAKGPTTIRNVANLRVKETDRLSALSNELAKLGATVQERDDGLSITPPDKLTPAEIASYGDHRMVMSFSIAALREPAITLENPACVSKSFPEFFDVLHQLGVHAQL